MPMKINKTVNNPLVIAVCQPGHSLQELIRADKYQTNLR